MHRTRGDHPRHDEHTRNLPAWTAGVGVALLIGFRPTAGPLEWMGATGVLTLFVLALTWLSVALGLVSKSVEAASNAPMPLVLLPFLGSGLVPTESMPAGLRVRWRC